MSEPMIKISTVNPMYDWFGLNSQFFLFVNGMHNPLVDWIMVLAGAIGHPRMYPFYMAALLWLHWRRRTVELRGLVTLAIAYPTVSMVIVPVMKAGLELPRPVAALGPAPRGRRGSVSRSRHSSFACLESGSARTFPPTWWAGH